jgi:2-dehydropantoate 2-reductase
MTTMQASTRPKILIEGVGSLGGVLAARLLAARYHPTLVTGNRAIADAINAHGIRIRSGGGLTSHPARALASLENIPAGPRFDFALLLMKAFDVVHAAERTLPWLREGGCIVPFQNGVVEPTIAEIAGRERVIGAVSNWAGTMHEPGVYEQTITSGMVMGELDGQMTPRLSRLKAVLGHLGRVVVTDNIMGALWSKLALNCTITAMGGLTGAPLSEILEHPQTREFFLGAYREVVDVARAHGISLVTLTIDPYAAYLPLGADPEMRRRVDQALAAIEQVYGKGRPSILVSLEKGRKTEIDFINGHVVAAANRVSLTAPINAAITRMIHEIESGSREISLRNIEDLGRLSSTGRQHPAETASPT